MKSLSLLLLLLAVTGCSRPCHRFVDVSGSSFVLDTKTGQYCYPLAKNPTQLPACYDLYRHE